MANGVAPSLSKQAAEAWLPVAALALVLILHGWQLSRLLGADWVAALTSAEPICVGGHAVNLYHGTLGVHAWLSGRGGVIYDPQFGAGYLKTPWYAGEARAAELFILLGGRHNAAEAWKMGLFLVWLGLPLAAVTAAWLLRLPGAAVPLAGGLCVLVCWSRFGQERLFDGDAATIFASGWLLVWAAALARWTNEPRTAWWFLATISLLATCWLQPLLLFLVFPAGLFLYLHSGCQRSGPWQGWFLCSFLIAFTALISTLRDAVRTSWLLAERPPATSPPSPAVAWSWLGELVDLGIGQYCLVGLFLLGGFAGLVLRRRVERSVGCRLWQVLLATTILLAIIGPLLPPLDRFDPQKLKFTALLLASVPAAYALLRLALLPHQVVKTRSATAAVTLVLAVSLLGVPSWIAAVSLATQVMNLPQLTIGLPREKVQLVEQLKQQTRGTARILWEESDDLAAWLPAAVARLDRPCIGGIGPGPGLDCFWLRLEDGTLAGKPLSTWQSAGWEDLCRRFNIGWVVVSAPATRQALRRLGGIAAEAALPDGRWLLTLDRPHSYFLKGTGRLETQDGRISFADLQPEDGEILVSLHHFMGLRATLDRVRIGGVPQRDDPLPLLRLQLAAPVARVTLFGPN